MPSNNSPSYPNGIPHVIVNGVPVIRDGAFTGKSPGRATSLESLDPVRKVSMDCFACYQLFSSLDPSFRDVGLSNPSNCGGSSGKSRVSATLPRRFAGPKSIGLPHSTSGEHSITVVETQAQLYGHLLDANNGDNCRNIMSGSDKDRDKLPDSAGPADFKVGDG